MCILLVMEYLVIGYIVIFCWILWSARHQPSNLEDSGRAVAIAFAIPLWLPLLFAAIVLATWAKAKKFWSWLTT